MNIGLVTVVAQTQPRRPVSPPAPLPTPPLGTPGSAPEPVLLPPSLPSSQPPSLTTSPAPSPAVTAATAQQFPAPPAIEHISKTEHAIAIDGGAIRYTATAGTLVLKREDEKPLASIFFVAYTRNDVADKSTWPVTFTFNGGPGSSSVWLHMGALGPKRVLMANPDGEQPAPPYRLIDNDQTALSFTDLVFIDPVTTGFSRHAPGENPAQFHSVEGDLESVADFIRLYTTRFERWTSPKFLAGESYGTTRAAGMSQVLLQRGIYLNGITLLSSVLNFQTVNFAPGNDLPYIVFLPTYTAAAWYHKKLASDLSGDLQKAIDEARRFAGNEYALALMKGAGITAQERSDIAQRLARLTGLSRRFIEESNLRVSMSRFSKELLRDQNRTIGRYDSRLKGIDLDAAGERAEYDPSYAAVQGVYTATFNAYVREELKYSTDLPYEILTSKVRPWSYSQFQNQYLNVAEPMRQTLTQNPAMRVLVGAGYYDLATPFFAAEYTVNHLELDPTLRDHVGVYYCDAGHMLYMKKACLDSFHQAMSAMYASALR
ncbi:MAG: peptidase S10 [Acidobacteriota bacterium]|nr:peptidase S10 [Acidobacteriota bacterium]